MVRGQLAQLLFEQGIENYVGFDFSRSAIRLAERRTPRYSFQCADARTTPLLTRVDYDAIICTEVLEHIEDDLCVVRRFPIGTRCIFSVPNFAYPSHVRYFASSDDVARRYGPLFTELDVLTLRSPQSDSDVFYLSDGVRSVERVEGKPGERQRSSPPPHHPPLPSFGGERGVSDVGLCAAFAGVGLGRVGGHLCWVSAGTDGPGIGQKCTWRRGGSCRQLPLGRAEAARACQTSLADGHWGFRDTLVERGVADDPKTSAASVPDVVLTSGPPHSVHALGRKVQRATGAFWAADFRDPWVAGRWRGADPNILERRAERAVIAQADLVIANAPEARRAFGSYYPDWAEKFVVIPNGYDPGPHPARPPCVDGAIRMLHAGEIYAGRDPRPLLDALAQLHPEARPIEVEFLGRVDGMSLEEEAVRRGLTGRVHVRGQVAAAESSRAMAEADILLLMDTPGRRLGVPAKLYEYIGTGRPVLALAEHDGDTAWALRQSGAATRLAPPRDVEAIRIAVKEVAALAAAPATALPPEAAQFTRANLAKQLSEQLTQLLSARLNLAPEGARQANAIAPPGRRETECSIVATSRKEYGVRLSR